MKECEIPMCLSCANKRKMNWFLTKKVTDIRGVDCSCVEDGIDKALEIVDKELEGIGFYTRHMIGIGNDVALLEVHVIILEDDTHAMGRFKLKNLHKHYRKR